MAKMESLATLTVFFALAAGVLFLSLRNQSALLAEAQSVQIEEAVSLQYRYRQSRNGDDERPENDITLHAGGVEYLVPCMHDSSGLCAFLKSQSKQQDFTTTAQKALFTAQIQLPPKALWLTYYYDNGARRHAVIDKALYQRQTYQADNAATLQKIQATQGKMQKFLPLALAVLGVIYAFIAAKILSRPS